MEQTWVRISIPTSTPPITHSQLRDLEQPTMFPSGVSGKESDWQCRRRKRHGFDPWVRKIPWNKAWQLTPVFLPEKSHGQRSLTGYSPRGHKRVRHD